MVAVTSAVEDRSCSECGAVFRGHRFYSVCPRCRHGRAQAVKRLQREPGWRVYVRDGVRNRASGTRTSIFDTHHPDSPTVPGDGSGYTECRWQVTCEDHATYLMCDTLDLARAHAAWPEWCEECQDVMAGKELL